MTMVPGQRRKERRGQCTPLFSASGRQGTATDLAQMHDAVFVGRRRARRPARALGEDEDLAAALGLVAHALVEDAEGGGAAAAIDGHLLRLTVNQPNSGIHLSSRFST